MAATYSDLAGKVVLVTGGASGIGEAIVRRFAQQKSIVVFFDIKIEEGLRLARELSDQGHSAHFQKVDLTDIAALRAGVADARKTHGAINVLVNNAAHDERHPTDEMTPEYWEACRPTRTLTPTMVSRLALATSTASAGAISLRSPLSPTMMRRANP